MGLRASPTLQTNLVSQPPKPDQCVPAIPALVGERCWEKNQITVQQPLPVSPVTLRCTRALRLWPLRAITFCDKAPALVHGHASSVAALPAEDPDSLQMLCTVLISFPAERQPGLR